MGLSIIILAAGRGSRMKSDLPKVLHKVAGLSLLGHAMQSALSLDPDRLIVVAGVGADLVAAEAKRIYEPVEVVVQTEQNGTAHAVDQARSLLADQAGDVLVLYGDTPFVSRETLYAMQAARRKGADVVVLGFDAAHPDRYGRLIVENDALLRIVEAKDATPEESAVSLCNSGVKWANRACLFDLIADVHAENAAGEYYLTDVVGLARAKGLSAQVVICAEQETLGVDTRSDLTRAESIFQHHARAAALEAGVTLVAPETVFFSHDTHIGRDVVVEPNVIFGPGVTIETGAVIRAFSHLEGAHVSEGCQIGPYARLRPGAELDRDVRVGNFVEVKASEVAQGAKINHLSYVGDARIGAEANIGAGTITCNYDGVMKHRTDIGPKAFIGSNASLVAPVKIGAEAMTASGSVITSDVPDGALALGRTRQVNKPGLARKLMGRFRAIKTNQKG